MKSFFSLFFFLLIVFVSSSKAQVSISYPTAAQVVSKGLNGSYLTVKIEVSTTCTTNLIEIRFPPSIEYVAGSVDSLAGNLRIREQQIGNLRKPVFSLSNTSSNSSITFRVKRRSICSAFTSAKDSVYLTNSCGSFSETSGTVNTYSLTEPVLSFGAVPGVTNALIGKTFVRQFQVTNGGQGCLDTFRFWVLNTNKFVNYTKDIEFNGRALKPFKTVGDTSFYKLFGDSVFSNKSTLCNGERVTIREEFRILRCTGQLSYGVTWGPSDNRACRLTRVVGNVSMANGVGNLTALAVNLDAGYVDMCGTNNNGFVNFTMRYTWAGQGNDTAGGSYNLVLRLGHVSGNNSLAPIDTTLYPVIDSVRVNNVLLPSTYSGGILTVPLANLLSSDPDGTGGLEDLDNDGFFDDLRMNSSVLLRFKLKVTCNLACNATKNVQFAGNLSYHTMCDTAVKTTNRVNSGRNFIENQWLGNGYMPSNITPGVPFRVRLSSAAGNNANFFRTAQTRFRWELILPKGFSVASNPNIQWFNGFYFATVTPVSRSFQLSNDTFSITSPSNQPGWVEFDLVYQCDTFFVPQFTFPFRLVQVNNPSTQCECAGEMSCGTMITRAYCEQGCKEGPVTSIPQIRRSVGSIGFTDRTLATRQSVTAISPYDLSKALFMDTLEIRSYAIQKDSSRNIRLYFDLPKATNGTNKLRPIDIRYFFYRNDSLLRTGVDTAFSTSGSTSTLQVIDWDLINHLPNGQLLPGDSIVTLSRYVVLTNTLPLFDVQSGGEWFYYGIHPQTYTQKFCNKRVAEMYLVGTSLINATNAHVANGCNSVGLGGFSNYLGRRFANNGTLYTNEFRPMFVLDSVAVIIPSGYFFDSASYYQLAAFGSQQRIYYNIKPDVIQGNRLVFYNTNGLFEPVSLTVANAYGAYFQVNVTPKCATASSEDITYQIYGKDFYYKHAFDTVYPTAYTGNFLGVRRTITHQNKGKISLVNLSQNKLATQNKESLGLRLANNSTGSTTFIWAMVKGSPKIKVDSIYRVQPYRRLPHIVKGDAIWVKVDSAGLVPGQFIDLEIFTNFTACGTDSLKVFSGWDCVAFPDDSLTTVCGVDSAWLGIRPDRSEIQLGFSTFNKNKFTLCGLDTLALQFFNSNSAFVYNPIITLDLPQGVLIKDSVWIEYPSGSGNFAKFKAVIANGKASIDLKAHPLISQNGIPGITDATQSNQRSPKVFVPFELTCDFISGMSFSANAFGETPCGQEVVGNGYYAISSGVDLDGIQFAGEVRLGVKLNRTKVECAQELRITTDISPYFFQFSRGDTLIMRINKTMKPGDTLLRKVRNCSGCDVKLEKDLQGHWLAKVTMDTTTAIDTTSIFSLSFYQNEGDTGRFVIDGYFKRNVAPLKCKQDFCENTSVILHKFVSDSVFVSKPPTFASFQFSSLDSCENHNLFRFVNTSVNYAASALTLQWRWGDSTLQNNRDTAFKSFRKEGVYSVELFAQSAVGCRDSMRQSLRIYPNPKGSFLLSDTGLCFTGNEFTVQNQTQISDSTVLTYRWYWSDGDSASQAEPKKSFAQKGVYSATRYVHSVHACSDTQTVTLQVYGMPTAAFVSSDTALCFLGHRFDFTSVSQKDAQDTLFYQWYFAGQDSAKDAHPSFVFDSWGKKQVILKVKTQHDCADSFAQNVTVFPMPVADFKTDEAQCILGNQFFFDNKSKVADSAQLTYLWSLNGIDTSTQFAPDFRFDLSGLYTVQLQAISNRGCRDTAIQWIRVLEMPVADFTVSDSVLCLLGNVFDFSNLSFSQSNEKLLYNWDFGDQKSTSTMWSPAVSYDEVGVYTVRLVVHTDTFACADTAYIQVQVLAMPKAAFDVDTQGLCWNINRFNFINTSAFADNMLTMWNWGDGVNETGKIASHTYASDGKYEVSMVVQFGSGCADTAFSTVEVYPMPVASFSTPSALLQCQKGNKFEWVSTSTLKGDTLNLYSWDMGDNTSYVQPAVSHIYDTTGVYSVQLIVGSVYNCRDTFEIQVEVLPVPKALFLLSDTSSCLSGNLIAANSLSQYAGADVLRYYWDWGDGRADTADAAQHVYLVQGVYTFRHFVESANGCRDTAMQRIEIFPQPQAAFILNDSIQCWRNNNFVTQNVSTIPYHTLTYQWRTDAGDSANVFEPAFFFQTIGSHTVHLTVNSEKGCSDSISRGLFVNEMPVASFTLADTGVCFRSHLIQPQNESSSNVRNFLWNWGDSEQSTDSIVQKVYAQAGDYRISLVVETAGSCRDTMEQLLRVYEMPQAVIAISDSLLCWPKADFVFSNQSYEPKEKPMYYRWLVSDGFAATGPVFSHSVGDTGSYSVRFILGSSVGCEDTLFSSFAVYQAPLASMLVDTVCLGDATVFTSSSSTVHGKIASYEWSGDAGINASDSSFAYVYPRAGAFTVRLAVVSNYGCSAVVVDSGIAMVRPLPKVDFSFENLGDSITQTRIGFKNMSSGTTALESAWYFEDGQFSYLEEPQMEFSDTGKFNVRLEATDSFGCVASKDSFLWMYPQQYVYIPNAFSPDNNRLNEHFGPVGLKYVRKYRFEVYNRWGELVFESDDPAQLWDGTYRGTNCPEGVYFYKLNYISLQQQFEYAQGTVHLLR